MDGQPPLTDPLTDPLSNPRTRAADVSGTRAAAGEVAASYRHCQQLARRAASSFYWSLGMLRQPQRRGMYALYAFSRVTDDLGDSDQPPADRRRQLNAWRDAFLEALEGDPRGPLWPAVVDTVQRFEIPRQELLAIVDGVMMDLEPPHYRTFAEVRHYCYHVASAVGLACLRIWGCRAPAARQLADSCGVAFQLTNMLRDLHDDARRGRVYLPREDLDRFGYDPADLALGVANRQFVSLLEFEIRRARQHYLAAAPLGDYLAGDARRAFSVMFATYARLLELIERQRENYFARPIKLGRARKLALLVRGWSGMLPPPRALAATMRRTAAGRGEPELRSVDLAGPAAAENGEQSPLAPQQPATGKVISK